MPVPAIAGQQARAASGGHYRQEVDLVSMFKDVAGAFVQQASAPAQMSHPIDRAVRIAVGDGATQMNNMAELITVAKYWRDWANPGLVGHGPGHSLPDRHS